MTAIYHGHGDGQRDTAPDRDGGVGRRGVGDDRFEHPLTSILHTCLLGQAGIPHISGFGCVSISN